MTRTLGSCQVGCTPIPIPERQWELDEWLGAKAAEYNMVGAILLAHADDGVNWGQMGSDFKLMTSFAAAQADPIAKDCIMPLCLDTLIEARLFTESTELFLWRTDAGWKARMLAPTCAGTSAHWSEYYDEPMLLFGTHARPLGNGFTLLRHGNEGMHHIAPFEIDEMYLVPPGNLPSEFRAIKPFHCLALMVRHYLAQADEARVEISQLIGWTTITPDKETANDAPPT